MAWRDDAEELKHIKNDVGSQLASMECVPRHNTIDCPTLYWEMCIRDSSLSYVPCSTERTVRFVMSASFLSLISVFERASFLCTAS